MEKIIQPELLSSNNFRCLTDYNRSFNIGSMEHIGERIKTARKRVAMSQAELAERSGVKQQMISKLESKRADSTSGIVALATALGVTPEWLQTGKESRARSETQQITKVSTLDDKTPEELLKIIVAYEEGSELKQLALQKLSQLPEDKLNAILSLIG